MLPLPAVFQYRPYALLWLGRLLGNVATQLQSVAIGWTVYTLARLTHDEAHSMFFVGLVGLAQFVPMFLLALLAGATADRYDRRKILYVCSLLQMACAAAYTALSFSGNTQLWPIFAVAALFGISRAFSMPASTSLVPSLIPSEILPRAIAWNTLGIQFGIIGGPWVGGILCGLNVTYANATAFGMYGLGSIAALMLVRTEVKARAKLPDASRLTMIREGLTHLWSSKIVLGAISLDLFAVMLGGVTALLPAYARDILMTGPEGFGHLRSSFAVGAGLMTLCLATRPLRRHAGLWLLGGVTLYGLATLCFAVSRNQYLSMLALAVAGASDSISVFVRQNLVQILTPDPMRGRVSAVSGLFISASNELGEFESGVAARFLGLIGSALFGGFGSIGVTLLWGKLFPGLRNADRLERSPIE